MTLMKRCGSLVISLFYFFNANPSAADWAGPTTVVEGEWGRRLSEFGFKSGLLKDKFPRKFHILPDGRVIIEDWLNYRFKIFTVNGEYSDSFATMYDMAVIDSDKLAGFYWDAKASKPRAGVYSLSRKKWLWFDKTTAYNFNTSLLDVADNKIYAWNTEEKKGYNYSVEGELLQTYRSQPPELGIAISKRSGPDIITTISYHDRIYTIFAKVPVRADYRDDKGFLYYAKTFENSSKDRVRQVFRYDICGKEKGKLALPLSLYEPKPTPQGKAIPVAEYGDPLVSYSGDVYAWVRSKTDYRIVKWTWVDRQTDTAGGPDAPQEVHAFPTASGVFIRWKPAPQDPGCVTGYEVQKAASQEGVYSSGSMVPRNAKHAYIFKDTSAKSGERAYYRIRSVSDAGNSDFVEVSAAMP